MHIFHAPAMNKEDFRTIQSLGHTELIKELTKGSSVSHDHVVKGIGDDAAVSEHLSDDNFSLLTSETFTEGVDFDLTYTPLHHLGYKVMSAAVSDIYAMNGYPDTALINLAVPNKLSVNMLQQIYKGIYAAGGDYNVQIVGGDLTASHGTLGITVTITGYVEKNDIIYRSGAEEGDAICVSGDLGGATAGLRILMREKQFWQEEKDQQQAFQPDLEEYEYVVKRQLLPSARKDIIDQIHQHDLLPHSMIDVTKGLISELKQLTEASNVGVQIYQASLPIALETRTVADEMSEEVDKYALYGGEDLELLFTVAEEQVEDFAEILTDFNVIGKVSEPDQGIVMQSAEGDLIRFEED